MESLDNPAIILEALLQANLGVALRTSHAHSKVTPERHIEVFHMVVTGDSGFFNCKATAIACFSLSCKPDG
jgi:hypothetical protein